MDWPQFVVQWLHVLLGILWFGYALSMYFLIAPALMELPDEQGRITNARLGRIGERVFPFVGISVLLLGILRGTVFGPIKTLEVLTTPYGIAWIIALLTTIAIFVTGATRIGPMFAGLQEAPDYRAAVLKLRRASAFDLGLFTIVFTCMVFMRFNGD